MASSSSNNSCFQCQYSSSDCLSNGWKLTGGEFAQLCNHCFSIYKLGGFCEAFHSDETGWRDCGSCGKLVHCGCIVSLSEYMLHDSKGVLCTDCSTTRSILGRSNSNDERNRNLVADLEVEWSSTVPESNLIPLFYKRLTTIDSRYGDRLVIPGRYAKAHFPEASDNQGYPLSVLDMEGKKWDFTFYYRSSKLRRSYALEGLRSFMISKNLKAGDTVAFYWKEPDEKFVLEVRKTSSDGRTH